MTQMVQGVVSIPAKLEEGEWGTKMTMGVKVEDLMAPKVSAKGYIWVRKPPTSDEAKFMARLQEGDPVTLLFNERGDKSYYSIIVSDTQQNSGGGGGRPTPILPPTLLPQQPAPSPSVYIPFTDTDKTTINFILIERMEVFKQAWALAASEFNQNPEVELTTADLYKIAYTIYGDAMAKFRPGMTVKRDIPPYKAFLDKVGKPKDLQEILIAIAVTTASTVERVINILKSIGLGSDSITLDNSESWVMAFEVVDRYMKALLSGSLPVTALEDTAKELGLPIPEL